jgi:hypothetical protein
MVLTKQLYVLIFQLLKAEQRSLRTSELLASLAIKKQGGALIIYRALRGWEAGPGGQNLLKSLRASPFKKDLSQETTFSPIRIAGQYL